MTLQMMRVPRYLWSDFEETVIHHDSQFLKEVARSLGLPANEVIRRCLGTGAAAAILTGDIHTDRCAWWDRYGGYLWRPCCRVRLTHSTACAVHMHSKPSHIVCLGSDSRITSLPIAHPYRWCGRLYWQTNTDPVATFREDGQREPSVSFIHVMFRGQRICVSKTAT
jgi:hypothetical protein